MTRHVVRADPELQPPLFPEDTPSAVMSAQELSGAVAVPVVEDGWSSGEGSAENSAPERCAEGVGFVTFAERRNYLALAISHLPLAAQAEGRLRGLQLPYTRQRLEHAYRKPAEQIGRDSLASKRWHEQQAYAYFTRASGSYALRQAGVQGGEDIDAALWADFSQRFKHAPRNEREAFVAALGQTK